MNTIKGCLNNFSKSDIQKYFAESEDSIKKCNKCQYMTYEDGIMTCEKLVEIEEEG